MYTSFFGLNEKPFSITPNPRYLYMSERHTEALAHLIYGIKDGGGFVQLTGEVGTGKTTLIRGLLQRLPDNADIALILNPQLSATEFLEAILEELSIDIPEKSDSIKALIDALNKYLLANYSNGRRTILIVDEAQNFSVDVLEQIRLLTNLETARHKLLQITLIGQPELRTILARNDLRQLAQRITARYHLQPLTQIETQEYVAHRLKVAGATRPIFSQPACRELYRLSGGIPRVINVISDRALLGAFTIDQQLIEPRLVRQSAAEVYGQDPNMESGWRVALRFAAVASVGALLIAAAVITVLRFTDVRSPTTSNTQSVVLPAPQIATTAQEPVAGRAISEVGATPVETVLAAKPVETALEELLLAEAENTDTRSAFQHLFSIWGVAFEEKNVRACEHARNYQLSCFYKRGSLTQIQQLDRPAILTLHDLFGGTHQVVLIGLNANTAVIALGGAEHAISTASLSELWFGEYMLLWRPQLATIKSFMPGMQDPDVTWLRRSLATIQGSPINPMQSDVFDAELEARVRDYQIARRLAVDGLVGQQTQIVINSDLDIGAPRLVRVN